MGHLEGMTVIITGGGRGIGREHALLMAAEGAAVVVNDLGGAGDGAGSSLGPADDVAAEIRGAGGQAVANGDDVADPAGAARVVGSALEAFGDLDVLVNNAGILRDRVIVNMDEQDWDSVIRVNLKGAFLMTRAAAQYWRQTSKDGKPVKASIINTSSESGVFANPGQANYAAAKSAVATLAQVSAKELRRYGVRANAILPQARTRLTEGAFGDALAGADGAFDRWDPANVSPFVAYLASPGCTITGEVFLIGGSRVQRIKPWEKDGDWKLTAEGRWDIDGLAKAVSELPAPSGAQWTANPSKGA
jgi:NAD(P)-dependent dehydrogenase (short-subunit alcohol dehydrogenase family)